jgi:DNA-binding transcriptional LysR family regulator
MDLKQLEHFVVVAEERHFTRAARRLNVVQSGLSATIRALEADLGGELFVRSTRRVSLTPAGELLLGHAHRVLAAARDARLAVSQACGQARGRLGIGSIQSLAPFVDLPGSLRRFHEAYAGVHVDLSFDDSNALIEQVRDARLDIAFTQPPDIPPPGVTSRLLTCEGMVVVCAPDHPLAGAAGVPLARTVEQTFVDLRADWPMRRLVDRSFAAAGLQRRIGFEVNDMDMLFEIAALGLAIALAPESVVAERRAGGRGRPLAVAELREDEEPCWELSVVFRGEAGEPANAISRAFLDGLILSDQGAAT